MGATKYRTIVADPPWPHRERPAGFQRDSSRETFLPYESMTLGEISALDVESLAAPGAHLYVWTTNRFLWEARDVVESWGAKTIQVLTWCKEPMGLGPGGAFANTTEFCLFGRFRVGKMLKQLREDGGLTRGDLHRELFSSQPTGIVYRWEEDACFPTRADWAKLQRLYGELADLSDEPDRHDTSWFKWSRGPHSAKPEAFLDLVEQVSPGPYLEMFARRNRLGWDTWGNEALEHVELVTNPSREAAA